MGLGLLVLLSRSTLQSHKTAPQVVLVVPVVVVRGGLGQEAESKILMI